MRIQREVLQRHRNEEEQALCIRKHSITKPWTTANYYSENWVCMCVSTSVVVYVCEHGLQFLMLSRTNTPCMKLNIWQIPFVCAGYIIYLNNFALQSICCTKRSGFCGGVALSFTHTATGMNFKHLQTSWTYFWVWCVSNHSHATHFSYNQQTVKQRKFPRIDGRSQKRSVNKTIIWYRRSALRYDCRQYDCITE